MLSAEYREDVDPPSGRRGDAVEARRRSCYRWGMKHAKTLAGILAAAAFSAGALAADYTVVVSKKTADDAAWKGVVEALQAKYPGAGVVTYDASVSQSFAALQKDRPRYVCFVAQPEEASRKFVQEVHRLTRAIDADPYADCFWGILTGYDAANALRIAKLAEPLTVHKAASGTELAMEMVEEGVWYCELNRNKQVKKEAGKEAQTLKGPDDTTAAIADLLNQYKADLFVTSGHATERDWMIGFRYKNGFFKCSKGELYGEDTKGNKIPIRSDNPKVYLPIGNCLMGHIKDRESMALAFMNSAGVAQMAGYTIETWYGYAGWGLLDYFLEQPGRYSYAEAYLANQHALIHRLNGHFPELLKVEDGLTYRGPIAVGEAAAAAKLSAQDGRGLLYDRDAVAFYGDPKWIAKMADRSRAYEQTLSEKDGVWTLEIKGNRGDKSFEPVNLNGSQRGWRPMVAFLPRRVGEVEILEGADLRPVITDDFILVPNPRKCEEGKVYKVVFRAKAP